MPEAFTRPFRLVRTKKKKTATENSTPRMTIAGYKGGRIKRNLNWSKSTTLKGENMSKMSQISAEMDEKNIPEDKRDSLINRVSAGMHAAEKKIDSRKVDVVVQPVTKKPKEGVEDKWEREMARKIRDFADKTHNVVTTDGKSYVRAGVYQYIAKLVAVTPSFDFSDNSTQHEVWCVCTLRRADGTELSHTTMYADKEEEFLKDKPDFAVLGMAQTRAFVRAMKNVYGYLVELAGYQSIAIEEIEKKEKKNG